MASGTYLFLTPPAPTRFGGHAFVRGWLPVVVLLALFCLESTAILGADRTSAPLLHFTHAITGEQASIDTHWSMLHHLIRKTGHFLGYGVLSLAWLHALLHRRRAIGSQDLRRRQALLHGAWRLQLAAIALTFAVAGLDELHQSFLPNRTGKFSDVLLDTAGALVLQSMLRLGVLLAEMVERTRQVYSAPVETATA